MVAIASLKQIKDQSIPIAKMSLSSATLCDPLAKTWETLSDMCDRCRTRSICSKSALLSHAAGARMAASTWSVCRQTNKKAVVDYVHLAQIRLSIAR